MFWDITVILVKVVENGKPTVNTMIKDIQNLFMCVLNEEIEAYIINQSTEIQSHANTTVIHGI